MPPTFLPSDGFPLLVRKVVFEVPEVVVNAGVSVSSSAKGIHDVYSALESSDRRSIEHKNDRFGTFETPPSFELPALQPRMRYGDWFSRAPNLASLAHASRG